MKSSSASAEAYNGIAETKIYFVSERTGHKEIWMMDYDGANQQQVTHLGSISLSPRISPDGSRLAFSSLTKRWLGNHDVLLRSQPHGRLPPFRRHESFALVVARRQDRILLLAQRLPQHFRSRWLGRKFAPLDQRQRARRFSHWNRKTGSQIAFVSGRTGLPQIYTMESDGTNLQRVTDQGYAVSPNWSPNGQFLTFSWMRKYGPGEPGSNDLYLMDIASKQWVQLTHDAGRNDFPCWSPDGRHIVFQSHRSGSDQIWSMLADGTNVKQLTFKGEHAAQLELEVN
jgi:TolB protein